MELEYSRAVGNWRSIARYLGSLREEEMFKLDLFMLNTYFLDGKNIIPPFMPIALIVKFKGKMGFKHHILPLEWITNSGIQCGKWTVIFRGT